jgi:hypothetical protein
LTINVARKSLRSVTGTSEKRPRRTVYQGRARTLRFR